MYHPNRRKFYGVLTLVDTLSDNSPSGARGKRIIITRAAAEEGLDSIRGMGVNLGGDKHRPLEKCGVMTHAWIIDNQIRVTGHIYANDFPLAIAAIESSEGYGMSFESSDAKIEDITNKIWTINRLIFIGASIMLKEKAAFHQTEFHLEQGQYARPYQNLEWNSSIWKESMPVMQQHVTANGTES